MLGASKVMAFVATADAARARTFYRDVLGLRLVGDEPYALVFESGGTTLRVQKVTSVAPAQYTVLGWSVSDIEGTMERLRAGGVRFETFGMPGQTSPACGRLPTARASRGSRIPTGTCCL